MSLIANADDPRVMARASRFPGRVVTFAIDAPADVRATGVKQKGLEGTAAAVVTRAGEIDIDTPLLGLGNLANVLAATAVAIEFEVPLDAIAASASELAAAKHRGELLRLPGGVTLIDDSYNSSPAALLSALNVVATATGSARKVAVSAKCSSSAIISRAPPAERGGGRRGRHRSLDRGRRRAGVGPCPRGGSRRHGRTQRVVRADERGSGDARTRNGSGRAIWFS